MERPGCRCGRSNATVVGPVDDGGADEGALDAGATDDGPVEDGVAVREATGADEEGALGADPLHAPASSPSAETMTSGAAKARERDRLKRLTSDYSFAQGWSRGIVHVSERARQQVVISADPNRRGHTLPGATTPSTVIWARSAGMRIE